MFDVGFSELLMTALVALLVLGPERLPKAARIAGFWLGKARSTITNVKAEIRQELHAEEMRQLLLEQQQTLREITEEIQSSVDSANSALHSADQASSDNVNP